MEHRNHCNGEKGIPPMKERPIRDGLCNIMNKPTFTGMLKGTAGCNFISSPFLRHRSYILFLSVIGAGNSHPGAYFEQWLSQMGELPAFFKDWKTKSHGGFPDPDMHGKGKAGRHAAPAAVGSGQAFENLDRRRAFSASQSEGAIRSRSLQVCSARKRIRSSVSQASTISSALAIVMRLG